MEGRHPMDYDPEMPDMEAFTMFLQDIKALDEASKKLLLSVIQEKKVGVLSFFIESTLREQIPLGPEKGDSEKIVDIMDTLAALETTLERTGTNEMVELVGDKPFMITVSFETFH